MHQIVVTVLCRLGPPLHEEEFAVFRYWKTPPRVSLAIPTIWGQNVTRNGGPQIGACLILTQLRKRELTEFAANSVSSSRNLVSSLLHTNTRLRGTH